MEKRYFNILAPFTRIEEVKILKDAGADELYCGYVTEKLSEKWPLAFLILNRRGQGQSFENYDTFKKAAEQANKYNMPVYVTLNGLYTPEQYPLLLELTKEIESLEGIKGIIVADLGFLLTLRKNNFKKEVCVSTGGTCFNSSTADFFHNLGAKRVILDRQLASYEIEDIIKSVRTEIGIELFIIAEPCGGFIDGYCSFFHCFEKRKREKMKKGIFVCPTYYAGQDTKGCVFYSQILAQKLFEVFSASSYKRINHGLRLVNSKYNSHGCRICDLYDLRKYPIKSLKIVGRGAPVKRNVRFVKLVSKILNYMSHEDIAKEDFQKQCKDLFSKIVLNNKYRCTEFDCYYPIFK